MWLAGVVVNPGVAGAATPGKGNGSARPPIKKAVTTTPIQHIVVIFQENISFDHYFGTYPVAANPPGEPPFTALPNTPAVNGLTDVLMTRNPNSINTGNGTGA